MRNVNDKPIDPDYVPNERKVWRAVSAIPLENPKGFPEGIYFIAIEELQGAWIEDGEDRYWEEAHALTQEWDEEQTDQDGNIRIVTVSQETMRARRYVLKTFTENGFVENAFSGYGGPRKYRS